MKLARRSELMLEALPSPIRSAFKSAVERIPIDALPEKPAEVILAAMIEEALWVSFMERSYSPIRQVFWSLELKIAKSNSTRRAKVELPPVDEFIRLVKVERAKRWLDRRYRARAPELAMTARQFSASTVVRLPYQKVECWSVAEMLHRLHGWHGLLVTVSELSFEKLLRSHGGELIEPDPKRYVETIVEEFEPYLPTPQQGTPPFRGELEPWRSWG